MAGLAWLTARPLAHRGLHNASIGVIENTASAFAAALRHGYGMETDLQISADGEAMVHHDDALGRLTEGSGRLADMSAAEIKKARFKDTGDRILTLGELCDLVGGRAALLLELKSRFDGDARLVRRAAMLLANYSGPAAIMSFDPGVVELARQIAPGLTRGIVAQASYDDWPALPKAQARSMAHLLHVHRTRPQFIAYRVQDLPTLATTALRLVSLPLLAWTVRSEDDRARAAAYADQVIFEGWRP